MLYVNNSQMVGLTIFAAVLAGCSPTEQTSNHSQSELQEVVSLINPVDAIPTAGEYLQEHSLSKPDTIRDKLASLKEPTKGEFQKTKEFEASLNDHRTEMKVQGFGNGSLYALPKSIPSFQAKYNADDEEFKIEVDTAPSFEVSCLTPDRVEYCDLLSLSPSNPVGTKRTEFSISVPIDDAEKLQSSLQAIYFTRFTFTDEDFLSDKSTVNIDLSSVGNRETETKTLNVFYEEVQKKEYRSNRHKYLKTVFNSDVLIGKIEAIAVRDKETGTILSVQAFE